MVEIADNDKNSLESNKTLKKRLQDALLFNIQKVNDIVDRLPKEEALKKLDEFKKDKTNINYFPVYDIAKDFLEGKIEKLGKDGYDSKIQDFMNEEVENISFQIDKTFETAAEKTTKQEIKDEVKKRFPNLSPEEIDETLRNVANEYNAGINEGIDKEDYVATLNQNETKEIDPAKLDYPETDEVRKIYKYKVEGKITSGINELDQFLGIVQPFLNQLIIIPWKFVYEGLDAKDMALDKFKNWREQNSLMKDTFEQFQKMGIVPEDAEFRPGWNLKKNQAQNAGFLEHFLLQELNKEIEKRSKDDNLIKKEVDNLMSDEGLSEDEAKKRVEAKYTPRKKFFDFSQDSSLPREILTKTFASFVKRDEKGKVTDDSKKQLKAFSAGIDLFNMKDKDTIPTNYADGVKWILDNIEKPTFGARHVEDDVDSVFKEIKADKEDNNLEALLKKMVDENKTESK